MKKARIYFADNWSNWKEVPCRHISEAENGGTLIYDEDSKLVAVVPPHILVIVV